MKARERHATIVIRINTLHILGLCHTPQSDQAFSAERVGGMTCDQGGSRLASGDPVAFRGHPKAKPILTL